MKFDLNNPRTLAITAVMTALVWGLTMVHVAITPAVVTRAPSGRRARRTEIARAPITARAGGAAEDQRDTKESHFSHDSGG